VGFSLFFWRKKGPETPPSTPGKPTEHAHERTAQHEHKERADAYLQKMAETLLHIGEHKRAEEEHKQPVHHHESAQHHEQTRHTTTPTHHEPAPSTEHELFLPKHEEPKQLEDHHMEHQATPSSLNLAARGTNSFYAHNGESYWTLGELGDALVRMSDETFNHHVSAEHNDFAAWAEGCFSGAEQAFAHKLRGQNREGMLRAFLEAKGMPAHVEPTAVHAPAPEEHKQEPVHEQTPVQEQAPVHEPEAQPVHHDEKQPAPMDVRPTEAHEFRHDLVKRLIEDLTAAHAAAKTDLAAAREHFIAIRTRVFSELSEAERAKVLPTLRHTYDYLRHAR